jgi:isoleucyl-tRNA synthetase
MSAFYLDVRKDWLYCERADGPERRATQTAVHGILDTLVRLMAPVLSFTAEEVWSSMPGAGRAESVFLAGLPPPPEAWRADEVASRFDRLLAVRGAVTKALEEARQTGVVKQSSEARVVLGAGGVDGLGPLLAGRLPELPAVFLVADVALAELDGAPESPLVPGLRVRVERAAGEKCPRCWRVRRLGEDPRRPELCERCARVLE